jgi:transcriptional regulator with XRE-family HTH domain
MKEASPGFGELLRSQRKHLRMTLQEVADKTGLAKTSICELEIGGFGEPSLRTILKLSKALKLSLRKIVNAYENSE